MRTKQESIIKLIKSVFYSHQADVSGTYSFFMIILFLYILFFKSQTMALLSFSTEKDA